VVVFLLIFQKTLKKPANKALIEARLFNIICSQIKTVKLKNMTSVTVAYGDGIGPEIMESVLEILSNAGAKIQIESIDIGQKVYEKGWQEGITDSAWGTIKKNPVFLKAPITTPRGGGVKSLNVTVRKKLGLFANIRPCIGHVKQSLESDIDIVIVRENEEDLYSGVEYRQTVDCYQSLKIITKSASKRICQYAFEYAVANNRKKVTALVKDNIMKMTDGAFHDAFREVASCYPNIKSENYIIDIGAARIATRPQEFDVVVTSNLYGDIVSDIAAEVTGSVGLCGSANIGSKYAMFEAVHGCAPDIAGRGIANPSGLLNAAIYMLGFIGQSDCAQKIYSAWLKTIKDGMHTADIFSQDFSKSKISTKEFTQEVIKNLNNTNLAEQNFVQLLKPCNQEEKQTKSPDEKKILVGTDIYIEFNTENIDGLLQKFKSLQLEKDMMLGNIFVKGISIWPDKPIVSDFYSDVVCCRFLAKESASINSEDINKLLQELTNQNLEVIKLEKLYIFGDKIGFYV
jgi:isocitrate dehydrogenase